ncbi:hypothetical protein BH24ACT10_BH24ACT10_02770 [soil metagenome]
MTEDPRPTPASAPGGPMAERMQALLARAAEEQLTEQRQVSAVLADLRGLVAALGEQLRTSTSELGGQVSGLAAHLAAQSTALDRLTGSVDALGALRPEVGMISSRVEGLATSAEVARSRETLLTRLDEIAAGGPVVERLGGLEERLSALETRMGEVAERLSDVSDAAGGVPAVATDLTRVASRLDEVTALRAEVAATRAAVLAVQDDSPVPSLVLGVAALREDVEEVRAATADSERRISAHVDEAVLALAEALLRRRRGTLAGALLATGEVEGAAPVELAPAAGGGPRYGTAARGAVQGAGGGG